MDNLSCVLVKPGHVELRNIPIKDPGDDELQIAIHSNGICASDVHKWESGKLGDFIITEPQVLGHESSGVVVKLGKNVRDFKVGDRVTLEAGMGCRNCSFCLQGRYNICENFKGLSLPGCSGTLANYINHPADYCFKLPRNVSLEEGALVEPLAIALHGLRRADVKLGSRIFICGAGTIGCMTVLLSKALGATKIVVTDLDDTKLRLAERLGATLCISAMGRTSDGLASQVAQYTTIDISIECSGANACVDSAIKVTKPGGTICLIGILPDMSIIPSLDILRKELNLVGSMAYANCYPLSLELLEQGVVNVKPMITHRYKLEDVEKAFYRAKSGEDNPLKIVVMSEKCPGYEVEHQKTYLSWIRD